jgi:hypothetical protein
VGVAIDTGPWEARAAGGRFGARRTRHRSTCPRGSIRTRGDFGGGATSISFFGHRIWYGRFLSICTCFSLRLLYSTMDQYISIFLKQAGISALDLKDRICSRDVSWKKKLQGRRLGNTAKGRILCKEEKLHVVGRDSLDSRACTHECALLHQKYVLSWQSRIYLLIKQSLQRIACGHCI